MIDRQSKAVAICTLIIVAFQLCMMTFAILDRRDQVKEVQQRQQQILEAIKSR